MMLSHRATCQKIIPWGKHTQCDAYRGLTRTFLFWEGKRISPCFSVSVRLFLGWQERWEATQNLDPKSRNIYHWNSWVWHKTPDITPHLKGSCNASDVIHLCTTYLMWVLSQAAFPWHISISPCFTSLLLPARQPSGSFFIYGLRVLLTNPFHLLRHDNPHPQFKFTTVMFQDFAQRLTDSTDRYWSSFIVKKFK